MECSRRAPNPAAGASSEGRGLAANADSAQQERFAHQLRILRHRLLSRLDSTLTPLRRRPHGPRATTKRLANQAAKKALGHGAGRYNGGAFGDGRGQRWLPDRRYAPAVRYRRQALLLQREAAVAAEVVLWIASGDATATEQCFSWGIVVLVHGSAIITGRALAYNGSAPGPTGVVPAPPAVRYRCRRWVRRLLHRVGQKPGSRRCRCIWLRRSGRGGRGYRQRGSGSLRPWQ